MKKIASILILVFAFTFTTQAQKKDKKPSVEKMLVKMTKDLDLTLEQQNKVKPLLEAEMADAKVMMEKRKELKESGEKPSKDEVKKMRADRIEKETAMNAKMEAILTADQFTKFKKMAEKRKEKSAKKNKK